MIIRNTKEFINVINDKKILSVDLGKKKVGLAISNNKHTITTPIKNIQRNKLFYENIKKIILEYNVGAILVGLPLNNDKSLNKISQFIVDISKNMDLYLIENNINLPIYFWDENFSSFEAENLVRDFYNGKKIDKFAAKIFLDDFIRENTLLDEKKINQPLEGVNILDLTRVLAGPTSTQLLGDLGANIIKIERPDSGDDSRNLGPPYLDKNARKPKESAYFLSVNRNKHSVTIDLTKKDGQDLALKLIKKCDVIVENFRAGNLKQYGLDYANVKQKNPQIIYCSITGFGQNGPYSKRGGYDYLVQAMGGIMSITGEKKEPNENRCWCIRYNNWSLRIKCYISCTKI